MGNYKNKAIVVFRFKTNKRRFFYFVLASANMGERQLASLGLLKINCSRNCALWNGKKKQRVKPIVFCGIGEKKKLSYQLWFVEWGKKSKGKTNCDEGNCKEKSRTKQL